MVAPCRKQVLSILQVNATNVSVKSWQTNHTYMIIGEIRLAREVKNYSIYGTPLQSLWDIATRTSNLGLLFTYVLVKIACISQESRRKKNISNDGWHLRSESHACRLPAITFNAQRLQKSNRTINLGRKKNYTINPLKTLLADTLPAPAGSQKWSKFYVFFSVHQKIKFILWRKRPQKTLRLPSVLGKTKYYHNLVHSYSNVEPNLHKSRISNYIDENVYSILNPTVWHSTLAWTFSRSVLMAWAWDISWAYSSL